MGKAESIDKEKLVIEKIPPPLVHIKLGVVNHLVDVLEEEDSLGIMDILMKEMKLQKY